MKINPEVSIIVPIYKAEKYLSDCIESILSQTFIDYELILVNDGSTDRSGEICEEYALKDQRIKVIHKSNGGASTARKAGVDYSTGKYIGWVDADDRIAPDMFTTLYDLREIYNADIAECQYIMQIGDKSVRSGKEEPVFYGTEDSILKQFFVSKMKPNLVNKLYKAELFNNIKFPDRQIHVDCYINMYFSLLPLKYVRTSDIKYFYILRENSNITTYTGREIREAIYLYDYTMNLAKTVASSEMAKKFLKKDAINRMMGRYFEVTVNSHIRNQFIYNKYIRRKLGFKLYYYLLLAPLPLKTRISYALMILDLKKIQVLLHKYVGKK